MSSVVEPGRDNSVQSVDRAISILQVLARRGEVGVTEVSRDLSVHKSTVSRLLNTLEARGLVEQDSNRGRYRLGYGIVQIAQGVNTNQDLTLIGLTICTELADDVGETVHIVVPSGTSVVTIDQVKGPASISSVNTVGQRDPMFPTAGGKIFLADMPPAELRALLREKPLIKYAPNSIVDPGKFEAEIHLGRERGYARSMEELEIGLVGVAAPIRAIDGLAVAALTVSGPAFRLDEAKIPRIAERVRSAAARISERNGFPKAG